MRSIFEQERSVNQDIGAWAAGVKEMYVFDQGYSSFNQDIGNSGRFHRCTCGGTRSSSVNHDIRATGRSKCRGHA